MHSHAEDHRHPALHDEHHHHHHAHDTGRVLVVALVVTLLFSAVEAVGGWWSGSLALLGDAGHMVTDATALGLAVLAAWLAKRPPTPRHSYGLMRAEVVAALANSLFMLLVVSGIVIAAIGRLKDPQPVAGASVMLIAAAGMAVNIFVAFVLSRGEHTLNVRGALLHVMGDLLGSAAALVSGAVIFFTGWTLIDPLLSFLICALILYSGMRLLFDTLHVIMEGVPFHIDLRQVGAAMAGISGVKSVHDLHIWALSSGRVALSAHVVIEDFGRWGAVLTDLGEILKDRFEIEHITLQPEVEQRLLWPREPSSPVDV